MGRRAPDFWWVQPLGSLSSRSEGEKTTVTGLPQSLLHCSRQAAHPTARPDEFLLLSLRPKRCPGPRLGAPRSTSCLSLYPACPLEGPHCLREVLAAGNRLHLPLSPGHLHACLPACPCLGCLFFTEPGTLSVTTCLPFLYMVLSHSNCPRKLCMGPR